MTSQVTSSRTRGHLLGRPWQAEVVPLALQPRAAAVGRVRAAREFTTVPTKLGRRVVESTKSLMSHESPLNASYTVRMFVAVELNS